MILFLSLTLLLLLGYTIYSLTNHKTLFREAEEMAATMPAHQLKAEDQSLGLVIWVFFLGGALLTGTFAVQFFSGSDDPSIWTTTQIVYAGIGCVVTLAVTLAQKSLYSSIHTSRAGLLITFLILLFVIFSEIATSSERTEMLVKHRSEKSQVYQGVVGAINTPIQTGTTNSTGLAAAEADKAKALVEIEACERHRSRGQARVDKCLRIERGNLAAAEARIQAIQSQNQQASAEALNMKMQLIDKAKELQYDENQNPAIIKFLKALLGGAILYSMIFASLIVVTAFEAGFHFAGTRRAVIRHAMRLQNNTRPEPAPKQPHNEYAPTQPVGYSPAPTMAGFQQNIPTSKLVSNFGKYKESGHPVPAAAASADWLADKFTPAKSNLTEPLKKVEIDAWKHAGHQWPEQSTYNRELAKHQIDSPADAVLDQTADQDAINRIIERGRAGIGTHETQLDMPLRESKKQPELQGADNHVHILDTDHVHILYEKWISEVKSGALNPTQPPARKFIHAATHGQTETPTPAEVNRIVKSWLVKAEAEGHIKRNPNAGKGKPAYVVNA